jgi:hypothetical protein
MIFVATKNGRRKNFFRLLFWCCWWIRDLVSGIYKTKEPGSGIKNTRIRNTGASVRIILRVTLSWYRCARHF